ncbi:hypothetical protein S7711_00255, partial [Stachybotrys chartarum IBT 7711]
MSSGPISAGVFAGIVFIYFAFKRLSSAGRFPLPPGPKGLPVVGNVHDLPKPGVLEAQHWLKHKSLYGPISSVTVLGQTLVIINDLQIANELLEKRSIKHSSRPKQIFAGEMLGWENSLGFLPYSKRLRTYRKNASRIIGSKAAVSQFNKFQEEEVGHFLLHLLDDPDHFVKHIKKESGSIILKIVYGYNAESHGDDHLVNIAGEAMDNFARAAVPGAYLVDILPFMKLLPEWMPGTGFKQTARKWAAQLNDVIEKPFAFVRHQMAQGTHASSFLSQLLEADDANQNELDHKWTAISLYTGGADTTVASLAAFFLAMVIIPEVQQKAREEIDRVVGKDRLPNMADQENLPYIGAIVKEVLRWNPVGPMALPHTSTEDDVFNGYHIPQKGIILANVWHFAHDPLVYANPAAFEPERFLGAAPEPDPRQYIYGFGRRVCPGRYLADNALYLNIAQTLAVFDISKPLENGKEVEPLVRFEPGVVCHPAPFKATIKPRSSSHDQLIRSILETYPWKESDSKALQNVAP